MGLENADMGHYAAKLSVGKGNMSALANAAMFYGRSHSK